jgi:hypothetical protein
MDEASWLAGTAISLADLSSAPRASQTRRISIVAGTETHIATLQAFTISRRTTREPPPVTIAILPVRP